jgi:hypothetical protein
MEKREEEFWKWYDPIQAIAERQDVSIYQIVNAREIWDIAYATGKVDGVNEVMDIIEKKESN